MRRLRRGDDRGAVAVLTAVLLSGGVLLGATAVVVDVGNLYAKREQLQAGADAAAWAVAENCIDAPDTCTNAIQQETADQLVAAQTYGPRPGTDLSAAVAAQVCIEGIDCAVWNTAVECPSLRLTFGPYVEVRAYYEDAGDRSMPAPLAGKDTPVGACSRVSWGTAASLRVSSLAVQASCVPTTFYSVPGIPADTQDTIGAVPRRLDPPPAGAATAITADDGTGTTCGFAWLDSGGSCAVEPAPPVDLPATTTGCPALLGQAADQHLPLLVPVYDSRAGDQLHVVGYAAYAVTGNSGRPDGTLCTDPAAACVAGYFTQMLAPRSQPRFSVEGAVDYGVTVIGRTG
ncbi:pilus assembly protein TadG-related protein [Actinoplanes sp. N902-109]|uniref:pilus assembly protein TadG-related protein n=1 Tax=Actinoplanes sp. (strain N902-109) TaxID=649831 RepID=UPI00032966A0|nr:pilus assembly protein TadG-related protein [Actinoplanes sp. N902-109]AGL14853.1 hypothetical protein L083_1343 [Actinoplanes sp. N902-109]